MGGGEVHEGWEELEESVEEARVGKHVDIFLWWCVFGFVSLGRFFSSLSRFVFFPVALFFSPPVRLDHLLYFFLSSPPLTVRFASLL